MQHIKKINRKKQAVALVVLAALLPACKKFADIPPPQTQLVSAAVFDNDAAATSAVTGIYSEMMNASVSNQFSSSSVTLFAGLSSDELGYYSSGTRQEFVRNEITEANHANIASFFWDKAYKYIYTANLCMEGLGQSGRLTPAVQRMLMGECKFIRAFCFFQLVNLFGGVPLPLVTDYRVTATLGRATVDDVYQQIIADLLDAQAMLGDNYPTADRVRPVKAAATALLARVYLYRQEWVKAEAAANAVLQLPVYTLAADPGRVFLKSSTEAIWQLMPVSTTLNTFEGNLILPATASSTPTYILTNDLLNAFEPNDLRRSSWVSSRIYQGLPVYYPYKYKLKTGPVGTEYYMVLRLAEQFLVRAEARAQQDKLPEALADVNRIRERAGLPDTTTDNRDQLLSIIEHERRIELFAEWGHRWYDLKRTNRANAILGALKPTTWSANDMLWPIPVSQLRANPALVQNPGY